MSFLPSSLSTHFHVFRVTQCKYKRIGCPWKGPFHELPAHEGECSHPDKTGTELMGILGEMDQSHRRDMQLYNTIFSLLCYEKIGFTGTNIMELNAEKWSWTLGKINRKTTNCMIHFASLLFFHSFPPTHDTSHLSKTCLPLLCPSRGAVQAVPHWWLHHPPVLWDTALHSSQPDVGAEGPR